MCVYVYVYVYVCMNLYEIGKEDVYRIPFVTESVILTKTDSINLTLLFISDQEFAFVVYTRSILRCRCNNLVRKKHCFYKHKFRR